MASPPTAISVSQTPAMIEVENENQHSPADYYNPAPATDASSSSTPVSAVPYRNSTNDCEYPVFISYQGREVKNTIASYLSRRLSLHGFKAFLDQDELQQEARFDHRRVDAIGKAKVHVPIFSPNYADSTSCLNELVLMWESDAPIAPIFYHVRPSDVRWACKGHGKYAKALERLISICEPRNLQIWGDTLFNVAGKTGYELEIFNGDEGRLLEEVVKGVLKILVKEHDSQVAKYPIGLDAKVEDFSKTVPLQQRQSRNPQIVGIVGFCGVGKTTFATKLFNIKRSNYDRSFFLSDVRENASKRPLHFLQKDLLKGLTGMDLEINSVGEGILMLRRHLSTFNVLIVLDDVNNVKQVDAFLPDPTIFTSGSLILITSRDKNVMTNSVVEDSAIYKLTGLDPHRSRQLFCFHAFEQPSPLPGFESLVDEFSKVSEGLPLSLTEFGALLHGNEDHKYWKEELDRLHQILPDEIQKRFETMYKALQRDEQHVLLDIACFFTGKEKDMAIRIWDELGWKGFLVFDNLENKCLVEVDNLNRIKMPIHLRDMLREFAGDPILPLRGDPILPLRLWRWRDSIDDLLEQYIGQVSPDVYAIRMVRDDNTDCDDDSPEMPSFKIWIHDLFHNLRMKLCDRPIWKLQLLDTEGELLTRILRKVRLPDLKYLGWRDCPCSSLPSSIARGNLKVLRVSGIGLKTLWHGKSQAPLQLIDLGIVSPALSKLPKSIGLLKRLEQIVIEGGTFETLPDGFCQLKSLKRFELSNCVKLKSLPESFGDLINLEHLNLSNSQSLEILPESFGNLVQLQCLDLDGCSKLKVSAEMLQKIRPLDLQNLSLSILI